jgi:hypothetical protein
MTKRLERSLRIVALLGVCTSVWGCSQASTGPDETRSVDKPFAAGGRIGVQIETGDCDVTRGSEERIRVTLRGSIGKANADVKSDGRDASVIVKDTPHSNFHCAIEVPAAEELRVSIRGGNLQVGDIATTTDVQNVGGNVEVTVGDSSEYASVDASVGAGDLRAGPFGNNQSGLGSHLTWSGSGKRTLTAHVGAGNLRLQK